jgi:hypothetical protein
MTNHGSTIHLVLDLHEPHYDRQTGRTWLERWAIRIGLVPPYPDEEEIGSVWVVLPGRSADEYESEGTDVTGPLPGARARRVIAALQTCFEQIGFTVVIETDYP